MKRLCKDCVFWREISKEVFIKRRLFPTGNETRSPEDVSYCEKDFENKKVGDCMVFPNTIEKREDEFCRLFESVQH